MPWRNGTSTPRTHRLLEDLAHTVDTASVLPVLPSSLYPAGTVFIRTTDYTEWISLGGSWQSLAGGARPAASFIVAPVGGGLYGATACLSGLTDVASNADAAAVVQACITQLGAGGGTIQLVPGSFAWGSIPKLTRNLTGRLAIKGCPGTVLVMSDGGRRIFDWDKQADHDLFHLIELGNFDIDASPLSGLAGSHRQNHVLVGNYKDGNGTSLLRYNVDRLWIHDIECTGVPTDPTLANHHQFTWIVPYQQGVGELTQNYVTNVLVERCDVQGGNQGYVICLGTTLGGNSAPGTNIYMDQVTIRQCRHDTGVIPTSSWTSSNILLGYHAQVRQVTVEDFFGAGCGDAALEIDCPLQANVTNVVIRDCYNGSYYGLNFNNPINLQFNKWIFTNCRAEQLACQTSNRGWMFFRNNSVRYGQVHLYNCSYLNSANPPSFNNMRAVQISQGPVEIVIQGFNALITGVVQTGALSIFRFIDNGGGAVGSDVPTVQTYKNIWLRFEGDLTGGGVLSIETISTSFDVRFDMEDIVYSDSITALAAGSVKGIQIGYSSSNSKNVASRIARFRFMGSSDTAPVGIRVWGTATVTIQDLLLEQCDFQHMAVGGTEIAFGGVTNAASVISRNHVWKNAVWPLPSAAITPTVAPATFTYQNLDGYAEVVTVSGGTLTGNILLCTDGTNFRDTGVQAGAFRLSGGDQLQLTYTLIPTMFKSPER